MNLPITVASTFRKRAKGMLFDEKWMKGDRILCIIPCRSVHTFGMRCSIDMAFVDENGTVLKSLRDVGPGRLRACRRARWVCERASVPELPWFEDGQRICLVLGEEGCRP